MITGYGDCFAAALLKTKLVSSSLQLWMNPNRLLWAVIQLFIQIYINHIHIHFNQPLFPYSHLANLIDWVNKIMTSAFVRIDGIQQSRLLYCQQSVKMNMRTFHKLSQQILDHEEEDKENYLTNTTNKPIQPQLSHNNKPTSHDQIVNLKRMNAKKIQQLTHLNQRKIQEVKQHYEQEKNQLIQKYQKIVQEKQEYIKMLEELYSAQPHEFQAMEIAPKVIEKPKEQPVSSLNNSYRPPQPFNQTLYFHQAPLYNEICYSIQRPTQHGNHVVSDFFSTQKLKSRLTSNQKQKYETSLRSSKVRSQSTNRNSASRHVLTPACQPKYSKIL